MTKNIIVAFSENHAIGKDNSLLWHISEDLKFFKRTTMNCSVIMGRKTFMSIGKPLPGRTNIVVTRGTGSELPQEVQIAHSIDEAFAIAENAGQDCFIIGGGELYKQTINLADKLYITKVHAFIDDADTFFPEIDMDMWEQVSSSGMITDEKSGYSFEFVTYSRQNK